MIEECKVEGCKSPAESSTGLCYEHEVEARMQESDEQQEYEEELECEEVIEEEAEEF